MLSVFLGIMKCFSLDLQSKQKLSTNRQISIKKSYTVYCPHAIFAKLSTQRVRPFVLQRQAQGDCTLLCNFVYEQKISI